MRAVKLSRSRRPESLPGIGAIPEVDVENLRSLDDGESNDAPSGGLEGSAAAHGDEL